MNTIIPLETTLGNNEWLSKNIDKIKNILPETWTHIQNLNVLQIAFQFKLIGIDWRSEDDFGKIMVFLEKANIMQRNGMLIRRSI